MDALVIDELAEKAVELTFYDVLERAFRTNLGFRSDRLLDHAILVACERQAELVLRMRLAGQSQFDYVGGLLDFVQDWHNQPVSLKCRMGIAVWRRYYVREAPPVAATGRASQRTRSTRKKRKRTRGRR